MWTVRDARNHFSMIVEAAQRGEPQFVTKRGAAAVVVLAAEEYARVKAFAEKQAPSLVDHLLAMPRDDEAFDRLEIEPRQ
jgi:antitoxin Phd